MTEKEHRMSPTLWAPYGDAIKLILTGSDQVSTADMSSEQQHIFREMLAHGLMDKTGKKLKKRELLGVQIEQYCVDEKKDVYESQYFIPDLFRYMFSLFEDWNISAPPVNLDYLNCIGFMHNYAKEGKEHWNLVCLKIETEREIDALEQIHHGNDLLKLEAKKRMRESLDKQLIEINKKIHKIEDRDSNETKTISNSNVINWRNYARELGIQILMNDSRLSIERISEKVHEKFIQEKITGRGGKIPQPSTIMRDALQGIKSQKK